MKRFKKKNKQKITFIVLIYFIMLSLISIAYSFLNENLEISGEVSFGNTVSTEYNYRYNFDGIWSNLNMYTYTINSILTYTGNKNVVGWTMNIWVPLNTEIYGCFGASSCIVENNVLRITNASYNGNLNVNNTSVAITTQITVPSSNYEVKLISVNFITDDIIIIPTPPGSETTISGINTSINLVSDWDTRKYYTIDIVNNSKTELSSFELKMQLPNDATISSIWGAEYIYAKNILTLTGPSYSPGIAINSSIQVNIMYDTLSLKENMMNIISFTGITPDGKKVGIAT